MASSTQPLDHQQKQQEKVERRRQFYRSFEVQALQQRSFFTRTADDLSNAFGSISFLLLNVAFFTYWVVINTGLVPGVEIFDPFPFGLLTMIVSLEAIFLSIIILVSQNRTNYVDTLREELHLQINLIAEEEITKTLKLLAEIRSKLGISEEDPELDEMIKRTNTSYIERSLINQIQKANANMATRFVDKLKKDFPEILDPLKITPRD